MFIQDGLSEVVASAIRHLRYTTEQPSVTRHVLYPVRNGSYKKKGKMLMRMWRNWNADTLLVGKLDRAASIEHSMKSPQKPKNTAPALSGNPTSESLSTKRSLKHNLERDQSFL